MKYSNNINRITARKFRGVQIIVFFIALFAVSVASLIIPLRPTVSETEKRELTRFPEFSTESLMDGTYFSGIETWFADTFPFRETLISWNNTMWSHSGIQTDSIHGEVKQGDEIPDVNTAKVSENLPAGTTESESEDPNAAQISETLSESATEKPEKKDPKDGEALGAVWRAGNSAYEYYNFGREQSDNYTAMLNAVGGKLAGKAALYSIIVPNSMGVMLSDEYKESKGLTTSDQKAAIDYMCASLNGNVKAVKIFDTLKAHNDEYIYFRTDHHWTADGAYYAYEQFAAAKGIKPTPLSNFTKNSYEGFLGTFYADTGQSSALGKTPDTVVTYTPEATNSMKFTAADGETYDWNIVMDISDYDSSTKYNAFIGGDNPYSVIENPTLKDGSSCAVVKESYGNAFVPFLVDNYQTVHIIDYRYYNGNLIDFVEENGVQDVIFINNIMATSTESRIQEMYELAGLS